MFWFLKFFTFTRKIIEIKYIYGDNLTLGYAINNKWNKRLLQIDTYFRDIFLRLDGNRGFTLFFITTKF